MYIYRPGEGLRIKFFSIPECWRWQESPKEEAFFRVFSRALLFLPCSETQVPFPQKIYVKLGHFLLLYGSDNYLNYLRFVAFDLSGYFYYYFDCLCLRLWLRDLTLTLWLSYTDFLTPGFLISDSWLSDSWFSDFFISDFLTPDCLTLDFLRLSDAWFSDSWLLTFWLLTFWPLTFWLFVFWVSDSWLFYPDFLTPGFLTFQLLTFWLLVFWLSDSWLSDILTVILWLSYTWIPDFVSLTFWLWLTLLLLSHSDFWLPMFFNLCFNYRSLRTFRFSISPQKTFALLLQCEVAIRIKCARI